MEVFNYLSKSWTKITFLAIVGFFLCAAYLIFSTFTIRNEVEKNVNLITQLSQLESELTATEILFSYSNYSDSLLKSWDPVLSMIDKNITNIEGILNDKKHLNINTDLPKQVNRIIDNYNEIKITVDNELDLKVLRMENIEIIKSSITVIKYLIENLRKDLNLHLNEMSIIWDQLNLITLISCLVSIFLLMIVIKKRKNSNKYSNENLNIDMISKLLNKINSTFIIVDNDGRIVLVGNNFCKLTGRNIGELKNCNITEFISEYNDDVIFNHITEEIFSRAPRNNIIIKININGIERFSIISIYPTRLDEETGFYHTIILDDVTNSLESLLNHPGSKFKTSEMLNQ